MRLVYSVRNAGDVIHADELGDDAVLTFTREPPNGWTGHRGRIDRELIAEAGIDGGTAFVCGSNGFVESASQLLSRPVATRKGSAPSASGPAG
jgi:ferredoxin-NADP reductase